MFPFVAVVALACRLEKDPEGFHFVYYTTRLAHIEPRSRQRVMVPMDVLSRVTSQPHALACKLARKTGAREADSGLCRAIPGGLGGTGHGAQHPARP